MVVIAGEARVVTVDDMTTLTSRGCKLSSDRTPGPARLSHPEVAVVVNWQSSEWLDGDEGEKRREAPIERVERGVLEFEVIEAPIAWDFVAAARSRSDGR